jgi:hypothetical protein
MQFTEIISLLNFYALKTRVHRLLLGQSTERFKKGPSRWCGSALTATTATGGIVPRKSEAAPVEAMRGMIRAVRIIRPGEIPRSRTLQGLRRRGGIDLSQNHLGLMVGQMVPLKRYTKV